MWLNQKRALEILGGMRNGKPIRVLGSADSVPPGTVARLIASGQAVAFGSRTRIRAVRLVDDPVPPPSIIARDSRTTRRAALEYSHAWRGDQRHPFSPVNRSRWQ